MCRIALLLLAGGYLSLHSIILASEFSSDGPASLSQSPAGLAADRAAPGDGSFNDPADSEVQPAQYPAPAAGMTPATGPTGSAPAATGGPASPGKPPVQPWKLLFFDNDFSYKQNPDHVPLLGESLKDIPLDDFEFLGFLPLSTRLSTGGELRFRLMDESNRLRPGGPARGDYQLWRWRHYVDLKVGDAFRVYAEMIDASMDNNPLPVTGIDVNRWDLQNIFFDLRLAEFDERPIWFRYGRQELSYGSQRLVSPLDWANTRRNFEGFKLFTKGSDWDFDLWFTRPVNTATPGDGPVSVFGSHFDSPNMNHTFSGAWFTYKAVKEQTIDLYWLWDRNTKFMAQNFTGGNRHTLAGRWLRNFPILECEKPVRTWHGEVEGGYQFGDDFGKNVNAGFVVAGIGHTLNKLPWEPSLWIYEDYASGSNNLNGGTSNTFTQQYGLVHAYLGQIDNIARQNINDINAKFTVKPLKPLVFQAQYHWFDLANTSDVLYTITGQPFGQPHRGRHVGEELDLVATYTFNPNFNVQLGYFWFWNGPFIQNNQPRGTAEQLYLQTTFSY